MAKKRSGLKSAPTQPLITATTETEAGLQWLHSLTEPEFRDRILLEVFRRMQSEGVIDGFENIHGRNDKGVDYLVSHSSVFGVNVRGIQIKSKPITRSESSGALSAVRIRAECEAALLHEFHYRGCNTRLEAIDLWCSQAMTEDAEKEMNPALANIRVGIKKDKDILLLIEKYCPALLSKVPQFAVAKYIADSRSPSPKAMRILGCNLNPSVHFIEPFFFSEAPTSHNQIRQRHGTFQVSREKHSLNHVISESSHTVVFAPPLSGRTYLLEHIKCKVGEGGKIAIFLKASEIPKGELKLENLIAQQLGFASPKQVRQLAESSGIVLLIDDIDKVPHEVVGILFAADPKLFRIVGSARSLVPPSAVRTFHLGGVDWMSIVRFLRTVDNKLAAGKPFVDRARGFIDRAFGSSGLPKNPFTIAVMLEECQHSVGKFSTPTMGRLIGRFIELQLGSHTDASYVVDFETKREFLKRLAGHPQFSFSILKFEKLLGKFIDAKGHPHSITDFSNDLLRSGVFHRSGDSVEWSHPVIKEYFWVKGLASKGKLGPIKKRLEADLDTTLAALAGSQLEDAHELIDDLLPRLAKIILPSVGNLVESPELGGSLEKLISDKEEESFLQSLENGSEFQRQLEDATAFQEPQPPTGTDLRKKPHPLSTEQRESLKKRLEPIVKKLAESQLHIAFNVAALIINARDTSRINKERAVDAVITSCQMLSQFAKDVACAIYNDTKRMEFLSAWLSFVALCSITDEMLGDPHLASIFRSGLKRSKDNTRTLVYLDLLLCCGEGENKRILAELDKANHLGVTLAFYWRVAMLYFFRFHRDVDRTALRKLLAEIRKSERGVNLPKLA